MNSGINPLIAFVLNLFVWGLGYIYIGKVFKGTYTFFLFALAFGIYFIYVLFAGLNFSVIIEILVGHLITGLWFGYDAYEMANKIERRY